MKQYYKIAKPNGFDFYTGKTINYKTNVGKIAKRPLTDWNRGKEAILCTNRVLHASPTLLDACQYSGFFYDNEPVTSYIVKGTPIISDFDKSGFIRLYITKQLSTKNMVNAIPKLLIQILNDSKKSVKKYKHNVYYKKIINIIINTLRLKKINLSRLTSIHKKITLYQSKLSNYSILRDPIWSKLQSLKNLVTDIASSIHVGRKYYITSSIIYHIIQASCRNKKFSYYLKYYSNLLIKYMK